jgi:membrane protein DedA with SNARE-associated domain
MAYQVIKRWFGTRFAKKEEVDYVPTEEDFEEIRKFFRKYGVKYPKKNDTVDW